MLRSVFAILFVLTLTAGTAPALANEAMPDPKEDVSVTECIPSEIAEDVDDSESFSNEAVAQDENDMAEVAVQYEGADSQTNVMDGVGQATASMYEDDVPSLTTSGVAVKTYKITYKLKGGKNNKANPSTYAYKTKTIKLKKPTRKGYKFGGWYSDARLKRRVKYIKKGSKGNKTLYAKWTMRKYKITYKLNGGKNNKANPVKYTVKTKTINLKKPKRAGYTFGGWYSDAALTKRVKSIKKGSTGNKKLYAKWVGEEDVDIDDGESEEYSGHVTCTSSYCTDYGAVAIYRNDSTHSVSITVKFIYYQGSTPVKTSTDSSYCLEPNKSCALQGWVMGTENYTSYSTEVSCEWSPSSVIGNASNITYSSNYGNKNVIVSITNNGGKAEFTKVAIVYYKNGNIVGYDCKFASIENPGSSDYLEFSFPHRSAAYHYADITPDSYQVFINESYRYSWD